MNKLTEESIKQQVKAAREHMRSSYSEVLALCDTVETLLRALRMSLRANSMGTPSERLLSREISEWLDAAQRIEEAKSWRE